WEILYGLNPRSSQGDDGAFGDPDGDNFSNLHEYLNGTDPVNDISESEALIFDETMEHAFPNNEYVSLVTNESLAFNGASCFEVTLSDSWHYTAKIGVDNNGKDYTFVDADELWFYVRTTSGIYTEPLYLQLIYWSGSDENMDGIDIQPYLYDLNGLPSTNITEEYKLVRIPYDDMTSSNGAEKFLGVFQEIRLTISPNQVGQFSFPQAFYVDRISIQDLRGLSVEHIEPFSTRHLEVTCSDKLDFISARDPTNHIVSSVGGTIAVTNIGLRSWVEGFRGSSADSPIVKHYIYLELTEPMVSGQTYTYSNTVQDVSGNFPLNGVLTFDYRDTDTTSSIKVNQVGWLPESTKIAYIGNYLGDRGEMFLDTNLVHAAYIQSVETGINVYTAQMSRVCAEDVFANGSTEAMVPFSGEEVWRIDFSALKAPGTYRVYVPYIGCSYIFEIGPNIYNGVYYHCMRSLWFQRSGISMTNPVTSGIWARKGDLQQNTNTAYYHNSILEKSPDLYAGEGIGSYSDFTGGWYDAADYNRYLATGCDAVNLLLTMYCICPERFTDGQLDLPESGNGIPDMLDEAKWELDWIAKMVSTNGAAYNKISYETWPGGMPSEQNGKIWAITKTTRDTAAACAILAKAARIYAPYNSSISALYSNKAVLAWQCLATHPDSYPIPAQGEESSDYGNPDGCQLVVNGVTNNIPDIHSGDKFSTNDLPYRIWAAIELYSLTGNLSYHAVLSNLLVKAGEGTLAENTKNLIGDEQWGIAPNLIRFYGYLSITNFPVDAVLHTAIAEKTINIAENYAYEYAMDLRYDFEIKSFNGMKFGGASMVQRPYNYILAYEVSKDTNWLEHARINMDWPLGANPLSTTFITGVGDKYPKHPHSKICYYDGVDEPFPGINVYGIARDLPYKNVYAPILDHSYPSYSPTGSSSGKYYPYARKYVDTWESVLHGEFVIDDLARTAMVFAYFSSTNAP
ncbi:MAG: glycoside hydrolase family 9 protein, partial [Kiritimatiellales bacterium]